MKPSRLLGGCVCIGMTWAAPAAAQHQHLEHAGPALVTHDAQELAAFVERARAATERYHDRTIAIRDGFRRLGPDFPAMGEHWVHPARMVEGTLAIDRPQALSYATIQGRATLVGIIYARPLRGGEEPPTFPLTGAAWHDHVGSIDEESVLLHHTPSAPGSDDAVRLAMLHAWIWFENPDGVFAADNWGLPFVRLGLEAPERASPLAARALSLAAGGDAYYQLLFRALTAPQPAEEEEAARLLTAARADVERWLEAQAAGRPTTPADLEPLEALWAALWTEVGGRIRPEAASRLHPLLSH